MQSIRDRDYAVSVFNKLLAENNVTVTEKSIYFEYSTIIIKFDDCMISFFEDSKTNSLYVLNRTENAVKFLSDYSWTYDTIVDLTKGIVVEYKNNLLTERDYNMVDENILLRILKGVTK